MGYTVRNAGLGDMVRICEIYSIARRFMARTGNPNQWGDQYPPVDMVKRDILDGNLYVLAAGAEIHGVFYFRMGEDPAYSVLYEGKWHSDAPYGTIHRIAGDGSGGILKAAVAFAGTQISHIRIDTHEDNKVMQRALEKQGFRCCGIIHIEDGTPRTAYDRLV